MSPISYIFLSILIVSLTSLVGVLFLSFNKKLLKRIMLPLVSFSTGAILGNVFLHFMPEIAHFAEHGDGHSSEAYFLILVGIIVSFAIEKFIHWRHCHDVDCRHNIHPVGTLILIGDAAHNVVDGVLIATAFFVNIDLGIATTIAVLLHEIPQEFSDFAVLIHSGFTKGKALLLNFISALTAFLGAFTVIWLAGSVEGIEAILLPLAAGNFVYIAGADLIPELHKQSKIQNAICQLICMSAGIALMYYLSLNAHIAH
ncbi:ZIP family metal transporter [Patescibacteria group bacterium]|nr:ZIP family metal transporter [Patescibacteria group bacterium]MBU1123499.1 ZIP family metal transporter [Patescibacteria group bacterium]